MESKLEGECKDLRERLRESESDASGLLRENLQFNSQVVALIKENKRLADCILDKDRVIDNLIQDS